MPDGHWKIPAFLAGLRSSGIIAPLVLDGTLTGRVFRAYVEHRLVPALTPGDGVAWTISPPIRWREAIAAAGASILYLPPYSPDLNP